MVRLSSDEVAEQAGVQPDYLDPLIQSGLVAPAADGLFTPADVRRVMLVRSLDDAGVPVDGMAAAVARGALSLDFLDAGAYERFAALAPNTFRQVSDETGIPLDLLMVIREAMGMPQPSPDDRLRHDEMEIVPFLEIQIAEHFPQGRGRSPSARVWRSTRRIAEQEGAWWNKGVIEPALAAGRGAEEITTI